MKLKAKRIFSALLCLCMLLGLLPASALATVSDEVAVTIGGETTNYPTLADGISALASAKAEDEAVVTLLKDVVINAQQNISMGVFTIDLNGCMISANSRDAISIYNEGTVVTIDDSAQTGRIQSASSPIIVSKSATLIVKGGTLISGFAAIDADNAYVTIEDVTIDSEDYGIMSYESTLAVKDGTIHAGIDGIRIDYGSLTLDGGSISGENGVYATNTDTIDIKGGTVHASPKGDGAYIFALYFHTCKDVRISGGSFESVGAGSNGDVADCICSYFSNLTISGGSFSADDYDIVSDSSNVINLTLNENGEGASFPGGISAEETLLSNFLGDGAAYWQGDRMIVPAHNATEISGDVRIQAACPHESEMVSYSPKDVTLHCVSCAACKATYDEEHSFGEDDICVYCGEEKKPTIVINMADSYGDGWGGNAIDIYADGELVGTATIEGRLSEGTYVGNYDPEKTYEFLWIRGADISECSFEIIINAETVLTVAKSGCIEFQTGDCIYTTAPPEVSVTIGGVTTDYHKLAAGISALQTATAADEAVLTILKDITLSEQQDIVGGVFTIDLNGCKVSSTNNRVFNIYASITYGDADITITDSGENGLIYGSDVGIYTTSNLTIESGTIQGGDIGIYSSRATLNVHGGVISAEGKGILASGTLNISGGSIYGEDTGIYANACNLTITDGDVTARRCALSLPYSVADIRGGRFSVDAPNGYYISPCTLYANGCESVTISGGVFEAVSAVNNAEAIAFDDSNITISGGSFSGDSSDIDVGSNSSLTLALGEDEEGATFPGGITVKNTTLSALLGAGAAYWQNGRMAWPVDDQSEITGGDVTVKPTCTHAKEILSYEPYDSEVHSIICTLCGIKRAEEHSIESVVTPPTCTEDGYTTHSCSLCGWSYVTDEIPAGHNYGEDNICTICGAEKNFEIVINMADSYGDGWNGNAIEIYIDGELAETLTVESDQSENTYTFACDPDKDYEFLWVQGSYTSECSFEIFVMGELVASAEEGDCSAYADGEIIYSTCEHIFGEESTMEATCTEGGCVYRACTLCGRKNITEELEALGHDYDANGICTRCGQDITKTITIAMKDSYGDGWTGNAIEIYVDGELEETVTIADSQFEKTYVCTYDPDKTYEFLWVEGNDASECSFEIFIGKTLVASAETGECHDYEEGDIIYTTCEHIFSEEITQVATCTEGGCIYVVCTLCNRTTVFEESAPLGHDYDANGICTRCGLDISNLITITMENIHGDGWHGSGIVVYIDGEYYEIATMEDGYTFTWSVEYDPEKVYEFYWYRYGVASGCGFTIRVGVEAVFETDDIIDLVNGDLLYSTDMDNYVVYVGGVELGVDQYLDLNGNVSAFEPTGGYAFYDGRELTLNNYSYTGEGKSVPVEGSPEDSYLIYSTVGTLKINLIGENTLSSSVNPGYVFGISMGSIDASIVGNLSIGGEGTLNLNVAGTVALHADNITIYSGTININAFTGIYSSIGGSTLRVYDGELNINASGHDYARAIDYSCFELSGGKVVLSSDGEVALDVSELNVGGGYLEVKKGGMRATGNVISFNDSVSVVEPEGAARGSIEDEDGDVIYTILTAEGEAADAFVISDGSDEPEVFGWTEIDGNWYFIIEETGNYATGITRAPYPPQPINGITYGPDEEAIAYYEAKGEYFVDEDSARFVFDENGVFEYDFTGTTMFGGELRYVENGFMPWHPGLVDIDGAYYYFAGDEYLGSNKTVSGNVYLAKNNTDLELVIGGVYTFDENGKLCEYDGITEIDGKLWYYEDAQLMLGKGLIAKNGNFYYVRSDGSLVVGQKYWVEKTNNYKVVAGEYEFDEDGKLLFPKSTEKHGIYFENGGWYYYENGKLARGKGLINTLLNWYDANGKSVWGEGGIIYVRSDGRLATGRYYISNIKNFDGTIDVKVGNALNFDEMGLYIAPKNGIYEVDGVLRYFINDVMQYNSGVIEIDGQYYYVRSNGIVVSGCSYWITNVGNSGVIAKEYYFDENGVMQDPEFGEEAVLNGISNGYYYEDGAIAYNKGLIYLEDEGCFIYVRSNGKIALGKYWITNHNNLLPAAMYDFGTDGRLYR